MVPGNDKKSPFTADEERDLAASLRGTSSKDRLAALDRLIGVFDGSDRSVSLSSFTEDTYHFLLDLFFACARNERSTYLRNRRSATGLARCGRAVRAAVVAGAAKLKAKTAAALVDHVAKSLPDPDSGGGGGGSKLFLEPLAQPYLRALEALCSQQVAAERLATRDGAGWEAAVEFCVSGVAQLLLTSGAFVGSGAGGGGSVDGGPVQSPSAASFVHPSASYFHSSGRFGSLGLPARHSESQQRTTRGGVGGADQESLLILVNCMWYLVRVSNAPVRRRAEDVAAAAVQVLQVRNRSLGQLQLSAFSTLNCVLAAMRLEDVTMVSRLAREAVPLLVWWWHGERASRDALLVSVRDEILKTIYLIGTNLEHVVSLDRNREHKTEPTAGPTAGLGAGLRADVEELLKILWDACAKRGNDLQLGLDDLAFAIDGDGPEPTSFRTLYFGLRSHNVPAERRWAALEHIAMLEALLKWQPSSDEQQQEPQQQRPPENRDDDQSAEQPPPKRRRIDPAPSRVRQRLAEAESLTTALQAIPFLAEHGALPDHELPAILGTLVGLMESKQSAAVSSWAMTAFASCAAKAIVTEQQQQPPPPPQLQPSLQKLIRQAWRLAAAAVGLPGTARAACVLLSAVLDGGQLPYRDIAEAASSIVTQNSPAILIDSSLALMARLLRLRNAKLPSDSQATSGHIIRWIFQRWNPADINFAATCAFHIHIVHLVNLIRACCGADPLSSRAPGLLPVGPIGQTRAAQLEAGVILRYQFLLEPIHEKAAPAAPWSPPRGRDGQAGSSDPAAGPSPANHVSEKLVLELLGPKLVELKESYSSWSTGGDGTLASSVVPTSSARLVSPERLYSLFMACLVAAMLMYHLDEDPTALPPLSPHTSVIKDLVDGCLIAVTSAYPDRTLAGLVLRCVQPCLPRVSTGSLSRFAQENGLLLRILALVSTALGKTMTTTQQQQQQHHHNQDPQHQHNRRQSDADPMDLDDEFSQTSRASASSYKAAAALSRHRQPAGVGASTISFSTEVTMRLFLIQALHEDTAPAQSGICVPQGFVDRIAGLSAEEFLACRSLLVDVLESDLALDRRGAEDVGTRAVELIVDDEYLHSELALCLCHDVLRITVGAWAHDEGPYGRWIEKLFRNFCVRLAAGALSPGAQSSLAELVLVLMSACPGYGKQQEQDQDQRQQQQQQQPGGRDSTGPRKSSSFDKSCLDTLLAILRNGSVAVKYHVGARLGDMFGTRPPAEHEDGFVDVLASLPTDAGRAEAMAFRLWALARLGGRWPTLLRRCTYHIFETPGEAGGEFVGHATRCMAEMARARGLASAQELFGLFAPQVLYTWLDDHPLREIPYLIFGFATLRDLLEDGQAEAAALMAMRGQTDGAAELARMLGDDSPAELVRRNLGRIMAYAVAHDESVASRKKTRGDDWARRQLGGTAADFRHALQSSFADTVAVFFDAVDPEERPDERRLEEYLGRSEGLAYARVALEAMRQISAEAVSVQQQQQQQRPESLPPQQQPRFRAKFLVNQLIRVCNETGFEFGQIWTPALVVSVARRLLLSAARRPALGSLHARSVLRRVRVLVALAGPAAHGGYPLQMLLHAVRPFLADGECAADAAAISRHLVTEGGPDMAAAPAFVAGYALSTLASLHPFLLLEATAAEGQQHTRGFHTWLDRYLSTGYEDSASFRDEDHRAAFRSIVRSASRISTTSTASSSSATAAGNSDRGSAESDLLLAILADQQQQQQRQDQEDGALLTDSARDLALDMLCGRGFRLPSRSRDDVIATDEEAARHAARVWRSCRATSTNTIAITTATKTAGVPLSDAYLAWAGRVVGRSFAASGEIPLELLRESRVREHCQPSGSEHGLLRLLAWLTSHRASDTAGLAESALRRIVSNAVGATGGEDAKDRDLDAACLAALPEPLYRASDWAPYRIPPSDDVVVVSTAQSEEDAEEAAVFGPAAIADSDWLPRLAGRLLRSASSSPSSSSPILAALPPLAVAVPGFAEEAFPFIAHLVLRDQLKLHRRPGRPSRAKPNQQTVRERLEEAVRGWLAPELEPAPPADHIRLLINTILYLRVQPFPGERSVADRTRWLDIDYGAAAAASSACGMYKTALLFAEDGFHPEKEEDQEDCSGGNSKSTLLAIFENIDDPDAYYGLPEHASLSSVLARLEFEAGGARALVLRGARYNHSLRHESGSGSGSAEADRDAEALVRVLGALGQSGLAHRLQTLRAGTGGGPELESGSSGSTFDAARKLEIWDLPSASDDNSPAATVYRTFQAVAARPLADVRGAVRRGLGQIMRALAVGSPNAAAARDRLGALAALAELDDLCDVTGPRELDEVLARFEGRNEGWMNRGRYDDVHRILSCRQTSLAMVARRPGLLTHAHAAGPGGLGASEAKRAEIRAMIVASDVYRFHGAMEEAVNLATGLDGLIPACAQLGLHVEAAVRTAVADALWDYGETRSSVRILQGVAASQHSQSPQSIPVSRAGVLSTIGHRVSLARLEKADDILRVWLRPALDALAGEREGREPGRVYHRFAAFCDRQLQSPDGIEDLARLQRLRKDKADDVARLKEAYRRLTGPTDERRRWRAHHLDPALRWLRLDEEELRRARLARAEFARQSLVNYLLALAASDEHDKDALRFTSLWMQQMQQQRSSAAGEEDDTALHDELAAPLARVPTGKFAGLMNQLSSRLQDRPTRFQGLLASLVERVCADHPFHAMYQIWTGHKARPAHPEDTVAVLRQRAMAAIAERLRARGGRVAATWQAIDRLSHKYVALAAEQPGGGSGGAKLRQGSKIGLDKSRAMQVLAAGIAKYPIPPPTMQIDVRADPDYYYSGAVPTMALVEPTFTIAGGVSAPKILTVVGSDGRPYRQLLKWSKSDDLRQDAIMEQVFGEASALLRLHRAAQQRGLRIRTYKVLPLTATAGLIEFVADTVPLHEFLLPAHERYHPQDLTPAACRRQIADADSQGADARVRAYRGVVARFRPVMRYFFVERFVDPDDWFARRLAYARTTAAISMLGHVLGVGDRHGHNILLDARTGEVVHIDLGIAFEMGRVLPIPETVPFRLTRDVVDGMGITGTEGVFRRCCEFTLDALREEAESIMAILDVLRYDPLYLWSISPARMQRLQNARREEQQQQQQNKGGGDGGSPAVAGSADRPTAAASRRSSLRVAAKQQGKIDPVDIEIDGEAGEGDEREEEEEDGDDDAKQRRRQQRQQQQQQQQETGQKTSEADRALEVVRRKLAKSLSVEATVYDLINQARDERNLALLFSGWAAYA